MFGSARLDSRLQVKFRPASHVFTILGQIACLRHILPMVGDRHTREVSRNTQCLLSPQLRIVVVTSAYIPLAKACHMLCPVEQRNISHQR